MKPTVHSRLFLEETERTYQVQPPGISPPAQGYALLFAFHGSGGHSDSMLNLGFRELSEREPLVTVFPNGIAGTWNDERPKRRASTGDADDLRFVTELIDQLDHDYGIDRGRVYATGFSNGGMFCQRLAVRLSAHFAAIASVCGTLPKVMAEPFTPQRPVSMMVVAGSHDEVVGWPHSDRVQAGEVLTVDETIDYWVAWNACREPDSAVQGFVSDTGTGTKYRQKLFTNGKEGSEVIRGQIDGAGHEWPQKSRWEPEETTVPTPTALSLSEIIWDFMRRHRHPEAAD